MYACVRNNNIPFAMATVASSSRRSSSTYSSSARYSTSSSYRSESSLGGSSDSLDPLFEPFLDSADHSSLFGEEGHGGHGCLAPFSRHGRASYGHTGKKTDSYLNCVPTVTSQLSVFRQHFPNASLGDLSCVAGFYAWVL